MSDPTLDERAWLDPDRQTERITAIEDEGKSVCWGAQSRYCTGTTLDRKPADAPVPQVGDLITLWPGGMGRTIRGKAINTRVWYWRAENAEERRADDRFAAALRRARG